MMKRLFCLVLALLMLLAVGCAPVEKDPTDAPKPTGENNTPTGDNTGDEDSYSFDTHVTFSLAIQEIDGYGDDEWSDFLEEKFNCTIEAVLLDQPGTQLAAWAAADELPTVIAHSALGQAWFHQFVEDEMIRPIPEEILNKYSNVKAVSEKNKGWQTARKMWPDDIFYVSRPTSQTYKEEGNRTNIVYRKDWAAKLGITKDPETWDELYDMLYKFTYNDPDGNGVQDTYGIIGNFDNLFMWMTGAAIDDYIELDNGDLSINWIENTDKYIELLEFVKKCYQNGLWDQEFSSDRTRFTQQLCGAWVCGQIDPYWFHRYFDQEFAGALEIEPAKVLDYIEVAPYVVPKAGDKPMMKESIQDSCTVFAYDATDEQIERALAICDWLMTEEGNRFRYWGFEGEDYKVEADGTLTKLHDQDLRDKYPSIFLQNWPTWDFDSLFVNPMYRKEIVDLSTEMVENHSKIANETSEFSYWGYLRTEEKAAWSFSKSSRIKALITDANADVKAGMNAIRQEAIDQGIMDVIKSVQDARDAFGKG